MGSPKIKAFLDTSAYLSLLLGDEWSKELKKEIKNWELLASSLLFLEAERNIVRLIRESVISEEVFDEALQRLKKDSEFFIVRDFSIDLCMTGSYPAGSTPRSLDLAHIRTAQWFRLNGGLDQFVSFDKTQVRAARELGLPIWSWA